MADRFLNRGQTENRQSCRCSRTRTTGTLAQEIPQLIIKRVEMMLQRLHHLYAVEDARVVRAQHHDRQSLDDGRQLLLELRKRLGRTDAAQPGCRVTEKAH